MWCAICKSEFSGCTCPDLEARLMTVSYFVFKACVLCGKHYARCRCAAPEFVIAGKDAPALGETKIGDV